MMDCTDKHEIYFLSLISKNVNFYTEMIVSNAIIKVLKKYKYYKQLAKISKKNIYWAVRASSKNW